MGDVYRISELAHKACVTKRTIHYYIQKGLLPPALGTGIQSYYTDVHLVKILQIKKLQESYLPLMKIKEILQGLEWTEDIPVVKKKEHEDQVLVNYHVNKRATGYLEKVVCQSKCLDLSSTDLPTIMKNELYFGEELVRVSLPCGVELTYPKDLEEDQKEKVNRLILTATKILSRDQ